MEQIKDGTGTGYLAKVDANNQIHVASIVSTATEDATKQGNSYNINTGLIPLTSSTESGIFYFKNEESPVSGESDFVLDALAIGIDSLGTTAGMSLITVVKNPTSVSFSTAVDMNENRNFGSSNELSSLAYKGAEAATITGGDDVGIFYQNPGTRGYYTLNFDLPRGSSIAVKIDTQTSAGTTNVYCALIGHRVDGKNR